MIYSWFHANLIIDTVHIIMEHNLHYYFHVQLTIVVIDISSKVEFINDELHMPENLEAIEDKILHFI